MFLTLRKSKINYPILANLENARKQWFSLIFSNNRIDQDFYGKNDKEIPNFFFDKNQKIMTLCPTSCLFLFPPLSPFFNLCILPLSYRFFLLFSLFSLLPKNQKNIMKSQLPILFFHKGSIITLHGQYRELNLLSFNRVMFAFSYVRTMTGIGIDCAVQDPASRILQGSVNFL